ncbi:MAG: transposase [Burkholderiales bacterium]
MVRDGFKAHKNRLVRDFVESQGDHIVLDCLPAYAPELNPVEYVWGYLRNREIANWCAANLHEVGDFARCRLKSMQRRPKLVSVFWKQAELPIGCHLVT